MTNAQTGTLVFKDQAGEYYLVPQETLEQGRVPAEHKAQIEHLIAEQQDVQGYAMDDGEMGMGPESAHAFVTRFMWRIGYTYGPPNW
jgi:hypothetical protein